MTVLPIAGKKKEKVSGVSLPDKGFPTNYAIFEKRGGTMRAEAGKVLTGRRVAQKTILIID